MLVGIQSVYNSRGVVIPTNITSSKQKSMLLSSSDSSHTACI